MRADFSLAENQKLLAGNWADPGFLEEEVFDTILVDYLVGSLDRFSPYFQTRIFGRLKAHLNGRLYVIGLEPYPDSLDDADGKLVNAIVQLRDSAIALSGDRPHREYPRWWVVEQLQRAGFQIASQASFPILYGEQFVKAELDVCREHLERLPPELSPAFQAYEKRLRRECLLRVKEKPLRWGADYVVVAQYPPR
jgi:hypothetical protein